MPEMLMREFAQAIGKKTEVVQGWVADGTLVAATYMRGKRRFIETQIAMKELAAKGISVSTDRDAPEQPRGAEPWEGRSLDAWMAKEKYWKAEQARLEFEQKSRGLIPLAEVQREVATILAAARNRLLGIHTKARSQANLSEKQMLVVQKLVEEVLRDLDNELGQVGE